MKILSLNDLQNGIAYLVAHPDFLLRCVVNAARLRLGLPLDGLRFLLDKMTRGRLPADLQMLSMPPGLRMSATVDVMGTALAVAATISVESVLLSAESIRLEVRVTDLNIKPPEGSPLAGMIAMMDLKKPGDLLNFLPVRPSIIVDAQGDLFVLDLMKLPKLKRNPVARSIVAAASEVLTIRELRTEDDLIVLGFGVMPLGFLSALGHLQGMRSAKN